MKVHFFDKKLLASFFSILSIISVITSIVLIFFEIPSKYKLWLGVITLVALCITYFIIWRRANKTTSVSLSILSSPVEVAFGDLFTEQGLKVICFNEYFDTKVDDVVISNNSLNGYFIREKVANIDDFDKKITEDSHLNNRILPMNCERKDGKSIRYKLGSIFSYDDYLLTAFSRFDKNNRAYLMMSDYVDFLLEFWNEIDIFYNGRTVIIPLIGSGITRFKEFSMSDQELLELLLWSFKTSRIKFKYPAKVKIIISEDKFDKISLYKLKDFND